MLGTTVHHPQFGEGQIVALYRDGHELLVRFANGLRFRRPRHEFTAADQPDLPELVAEPKPIYQAPAPMPQTQLAARQLLESLRMGIAPAQHVRELTVALDDERASLVHGLADAHERGGAVRAVIGDYGFGKSHLVELTTQEALGRGFLVASASLDLLELPPHRSFDIYREAMHHLRYPDSDQRGLGPLLEKAVSMEHVLPRLGALSPAELDPLLIGLTALNNTVSSRQRQAWSNWLMGGRRVRLLNKAMPRGVKFPSIYRIGHNARQIAYLMTAVSALARLNNYSGLCVLLDEAESYSLLRPYQRPKASLFFQAVIYAALRENQSAIRPDIFPQHRWRDYPLAYDVGQALFFLFTVTHSDERMPLQDWLSPEQILTLRPQATPQEIGRFLQQILDYHSQAYTYESGERQTQVRRGAAELLAQGMRNDRLTMRSIVRLAVELYDLLFFYDDYDVATLLAELRAQVA